MKASDGLNGAICGNCDYAYPNAKTIGSQKPEHRKPCPVCGSTSITFRVSVASKVTVRSILGLKSKRQGVKKPVAEVRTGDDLHRKTGRWMKLERHIDRENNRYTEKVTDPKTGRVIHETNELLTDHKGHGSAKKKNTDEKS